MTGPARRGYRNPVVRGLSPDPTVCRVGPDFFLATSTLDSWPGIPIRHSTDLVHWQVIGHAVTRPAQYRRDGRPGPLRLYAPTLRHHDGRFHLACTNVAPGQGNFLVHADDPAGPWSDGLWVDGDGFDPSLVFDGDTAYYTRRTVVPGKEGSGPVVQAEIDVRTGRLLTATRPITPGEAGWCSNDIEAPHLYRIGGWWYLLAAEGGTWKGHMATVARSRSPWGPFEGCPRNPVLTHRHRVGHPVQSTGHADLVDDADGRWWAVFLGTRHLGPTAWHHLGRETFLAPVRWDADGWPVIGHGDGTELEVAADLPPAGDAGWPHRASVWTSGWSTRQPPVAGTEIEQTGQTVSVRIPQHPGRLDGAGAGPAVYLTQPEPDCVFTATVAGPPAAPAEAGVAVCAAPDHHYALLVGLADGARRVTLRRTVGDLVDQQQTVLPGDGPITLRIAAAGAGYRFAARDPDDPAAAWVEIGTGLARLISAEASASYSAARFVVLARDAATTLTDVALTLDRSEETDDDPSD